ncbi:Phospholipase A2 [Araneus ventricosus]|uniref:Phospholipase A2 n=1 Tax=Araneus ventricosus TaxID=182803 RepID=A0A4Y2KMI8_ARAVE|nr:Phospholipase A2 [Araneus ventricosus]
MAGDGYYDFTLKQAIRVFSKIRDIKETSKHQRYSYPEEEFEKISEDCFSSAEDSEINLPEEQPKAAEKREMSLPDETPRKLGSLVTDPVEELKTTASQATQKASGWLIYPGTKWCGVGNVAASDDDLGPEEETDKCCRTHDKCRDFISGGETKYNLTNKSSYVSLSCECDNKFYECLRRANTISSNSVGFLYFNFFARKCFSLDYPKKCKKYTMFSKICSEYVADTLTEKIYLWLPPKKYKKL